MGGRQLRPGPYKLSFTLNGVIHTQAIEIRSGMITQVDVSPGVIRYRNKGPGGTSPGTLISVRLYDRTQALLETTQDPRHGLHLPPGHYDMEFRTPYGAIWKRKLSVAAGSTLTLDIQWSRIRFQGGNPATATVAIRPLQAEGLRGTWLGLTKQADLPPGDYEVRWNVGQRQRLQRIRIEEGQVHSLRID